MPRESDSAGAGVETGRIGGPLYGGTFRCGGAALPPVAFVLPGERVALPVRAGLPVVLEAAEGRVEPGCVHFGACGGCHYQHAEYGLQLRLKRELLGELLKDAGLSGLPGISVHAGEPWGYRNRIRLRVEQGTGAGASGRDAPGRFRVGYRRAGSREFLPIRMCPIAAPLLWRAAEALLQMGGEREGERWLEATAEVELFCQADESRLQMTLLLREAGPGLRAPGSFIGFCERLRDRVPELAGAGAQLHPELERRVRRARGGWPGESWGVAGLMYTAGGSAHWVGRGAFFQVNRFLVDRLVELVCREHAGELAWDLYAGVGLFTRKLLERFARVTAVEGGESAAEGLVAASRAAGRRSRPAFEAVHAATLEFLQARRYGRERPDLVVVDPPRAGLGAEAAEALAQIGAARMVYVSCDPVTLARDLKVLTAASYRINAVDLVDLFPQTFHIETVVQLQRR